MDHQGSTARSPSPRGTTSPALEGIFTDIDLLLLVCGDLSRVGTATDIS